MPQPDLLPDSEDRGVEQTQTTLRAQYLKCCPQIVKNEGCMQLQKRTIRPTILMKRNTWGIPKAAGVI